MPLRQCCRGINPKMAAAALAAEESCFQHQPAGEKAMVEIQKQVEIPAAAVTQFQGFCMFQIIHQVQERLFFQPALLLLHLLECLA